MKTFEGKLVSKDIRIGIVAARFNEFITSKLLSGALDGLKRHEVSEDSIDIAWVPKYRSLLPKWQKAGNTMRSSALALRFAAAQATTTMCAVRFRRALLMYP